MCPVGSGALSSLSSLLSSLSPTLRVHVEMSSFPDEAQLRAIVSHAVSHADSLGLNEQELPSLRRLLAGGGGPGGPGGGEVASDSHPRVAVTLDNMRAVFELLGAGEVGEGARRGEMFGGEKGRRLTRLHVHTLAYQVGSVF